MGLREAVNRRPGAATGISVGVLAIALVIIVRQVIGFYVEEPGPQLFYYTIDDGKTYFADVKEKVTPFLHEGKPAVECHVYKCSSGAEFVAFLQRYPLRKDGKPYETPPPISAEVKRPGESGWVLRDSAQGEAIVAVTCPDGSTEGLRERFP